MGKFHEIPSTCLISTVLEVIHPVDVLTVSSDPEMFSWERPSWWAATSSGFKTWSEGERQKALILSVIAKASAPLYQASPVSTMLLQTGHTGLQ